MTGDVTGDIDVITCPAGNAPPTDPIPPAPVAADLLVTAHFVRAGRVGGAEHMLYNLVHGLAGRTRRVSVLCGSRHDLDPGFVAALGDRGSAGVVETGGGGSRFLAEQRACLDPAISGDAILFSNYFVPPVLPRRLGKTSVVLHDMQYRHFPQYFSATKRSWLRMAHRFALRRADRIIAISEFGRKDAIHWLGRSAESKLAVIPNPISWLRFGSGSDARPLERPYILSVAAHYPHKNLEVLIRAFVTLSRRDRDIMLVLCGQDYRNLTGVSHRPAGGLRQLIDELGIGDRVLSTGYIDDLALGQWYRHAACFAFPSVFEGFGMPAIEALGFGLPTLLTRCTAIPETSLGLGTYVDQPTSADEWAARLGEMTRRKAAFAVAPGDVARLRRHYAPERIAGLYLDTCLR